MSVIENPALKAFVAQFPNELVFAQVLIRRSGAGYELRHADDAPLAADSLRLIEILQTRALAQTTATGEFRPLKSAPTLTRGWRIVAKSDAELETALSHLYPGAIADWYAAQSAQPPVTHYREYTNRQSGMYRITTMLDDAAATRVIQTVCVQTLCLKRRLWTVNGLSPDAPGEKSLIPCLEPCAVLMESARRAVRAEQQEKTEQLAKLAVDPKSG
jgi:hypothetical protein